MSSTGTRPLAEKTRMNATSCNSITLSDPIKPPPPPPAAAIPDHRPFSPDDDVLSLSVLGPTARDTPDMISLLLIELDLMIQSFKRISKLLVSCDNAEAVGVEFMKRGSLVNVVPREAWVMYTCPSEDASVHCLPFYVSYVAMLIVYCF